jgi:hypothetical protein
MRKSLGFLLAIVTVALFAGPARAERGSKRPPPEPAIPTSEAIAPAMEGVEWGWGHEKVVAHYTKKLRELYRPVLAKAHDAVLEDRIRREMESRQVRIEKSHVEFTGQRTGWDSSFLRNEYTHDNGEALIEVRQLLTGEEDVRYTDYFFFINNKVWRRYRAFNQDAFGGMSFDEAGASFQKAFGPAKEVRDGSGALSRLVWCNETTKLEAIDNTRFYGFFSLVFTDTATEGRLAELRTNKAPAKSGLNPLVEALDEDASDDVHQNVVEHITGKRYKTAQPQEPVEQEPRVKKGSSKAQPAPAKAGTIFDEPASPSKTPSKSSGNPLDDLDI